MGNNNLKQMESSDTYHRDHLEYIKNTLWMQK